MKKLVFSLFAVFLVPAYCLIAGAFPAHINYTNLFACILYSLLTLWCIFLLRGKEVRKGDLFLALVIGLLTTAYTIPLRAIGITAAVCTACVFLSCRNMLAKTDSSFVWIRAGIKPNLLILLGISLLYFLIFMTRYEGPFKFSPLLLLKALAPAIYEEMIFRVFLPVMLFKAFKLDNTLGNRAWVFIVITIPFALLHGIDLLMANDIPQVLSRCWTLATNSLISAVFIYRCGFFYGVYAHALSDFLAMSLLMY